MHPSKLISTLGWYVGRFKLLTGIVTLGAATAILAISGRGRPDNRNPAFVFLLLIFAALSLLFFADRRERTTRSLSS